MKLDGKKVIGYREAMSLPQQPKSMIVVGVALLVLNSATSIIAWEQKLRSLNFYQE
jgi:hypothetical protein